MKLRSYQLLTKPGGSPSLFLLLMGSFVLLMLPWALSDHFLWLSQFDIRTFRSLNASLQGNEGIQLFWAAMNLKFFGDIVLILLPILSFSWWWNLEADEKGDGLVLLLYATLYGALSLVLNKLILQNLGEIRRDSPTVLLEDAFRLSTVLPEWAVKDFSRSSFPGDHAVFLGMWAGFMLHFSRGKLWVWALVLTPLLCLPRLVSGGHWLSDVLGGLALASLSLAIGLASPLPSLVLPEIQKLLRKIIPGAKAKTG